MNKNNLLLIVAGLLILFGLGNKLGIVNNVSDTNCSINLNQSHFGNIAIKGTISEISAIIIKQRNIQKVLSFYFFISIYAIIV